VAFSEAWQVLERLASLYRPPGSDALTQLVSENGVTLRDPFKYRLATDG
jgi:hypothetical protein